MASNKDQISTREVFVAMRCGLGLESTLIRLPNSFFAAFFFLMGKSDFYKKLFGSYTVDSGKSVKMLGWDNSRSISSAFEHVGRHKG